MKNVRRTSWHLVGVAVLCCGPSLLADANMTLTGGGNNGALAGIYVGPYQGTINGVSTAIICDDFIHDSYFNESWVATVSTFSDLTKTMFGPNSTKYDQAAWLALQLVNPATTCPTTSTNCAGDIQYAIWQVFDNTGSTPFSWLASYGGLDNDLSNAQYWLNQAQTQTYTSGEFSNVTIYTPNANPVPTCGGGPCPSAPPQEFLTVATPEPTELALLGIDLLGVGVLLLVLRGRRAVSQSHS